MERNQFTLHCQSQICMASGRVIGEWVLRQSCRQLKDRISAGMREIIMAVNLSSVQFRHADLPGLVSRALNECQLAPTLLELELTEGVSMNNPLGAIAVMNDLHDRAVRMSIDDFGTGYSSLSCLRKFRVCKLKIDQQFVRNLYDDPEQRAIVSAIIDMANWTFCASRAAMRCRLASSPSRYRPMISAASCGSGTGRQLALPKALARLDEAAPIFLSPFSSARFSLPFALHPQASFAIRGLGSKF